jgi:Thrombospondin type 3 repeat
MKVGVLGIMVSFLLAAGLPLAVLAGTPAIDTDNDTVVDTLDNCVNTPNAGALFCDTDQDGYGNACDADTNNDGIIGGPDFGSFTSNFGATGPNVADLNCDQVVGGPDFGKFTASFGGAPGPSGLSCAGTIPCN